MITDNVIRINEVYETMGTKLKNDPKNKDELLALKKIISANEDDLKKLKWEVLYVYNFMLILENYSF
jgi:hypothetical protein